MKSCRYRLERCGSVVRKMTQRKSQTRMVHGAILSAHKGWRPATVLGGLARISKEKYQETMYGGVGHNNDGMQNLERVDTRPVMRAHTPTFLAAYLAHRRALSRETCA